MPLRHSFEQLKLKSSWVTIGNFDGVHLGHQRIINALVSGARAEGVPSVVVTFDPHPAKVLGGIELPCLTTLDEKFNILSELGVDEMLALRFSREMSALSPIDFLETLQGSSGFTQLLTGYDFALGKNRVGDNASLTQIADRWGFNHQAFSAVELQNGIISSTRIRTALAEGNVAFAARAMGRPYRVSGEVYHGDGRGRSINIPTANVRVPLGKALPRNGVYATIVLARGIRYAAVTNFGFRPTFIQDAPSPRLEPHILDFDQDLYGEEISVDFVEFLRPEIKFNGVEELLTQIKNDIDATRAMRLV